jgi:predicted MPP superfamily phosphohydrolase
MKRAAAVLAAALAVLLLYAFWWEPDSLRVREYQLALEAPALKGLTIAVIADLHAGAPYMDTAKLDAVVAATMAARPDLILLAGDYVSDREDRSLRMPLDVIAEHLKGLDAPLGVYAVMGNHDDRAGPRRIRAALGQAGILVLNNSHAVIGRTEGTVILAGIDTWFGAGDGSTALEGLGGQKVLCLTHKPDVFPDLPSTCVLTIAGHTHGGQVALPLIRRLALEYASRYGERYGQGIVREGGKTLFVSTGIGTTTLPVRLGVPPEISLLKIQ